MSLTSLAFLAFLCMTAALYRFVPTGRAWVLLIGSYIFYYLNCKGMMALLLADTVAVFYAGRALKALTASRSRSALLSLVIFYLIGSLALFKAASKIQDMSLAGTALTRVALPLGISYYTFKLLGYIIDVYWRASEPETSLLSFGVYVSYFPQIVAGPIQRSESFLFQLKNPQVAGRQMVLLGCQRIALGFFKKLVVADSLAVLVSYAYQNVHAAGAPTYIGFYLFPLQMYTDFSALTDIAVGASLLLGIHSPENFEAPFAAPSPSEYWRRWHITLTTFLTDYVFIPLRLSMRSLGNIGLVVSLVINMVLIGLWHGFRWTFVLFGLIHACYLSVDALTKKYRQDFYRANPNARRLAAWFGPVFTFHLVAVAFVFFRVANPRDAILVLRHLFDSGSVFSRVILVLVSHRRFAVMGIAGYVVAEFLDYLRRQTARTELLQQLPRWGRWSVYSCTAISYCFLVMLIVVVGTNGSPFLYAVF